MQLPSRLLSPGLPPLMSNGHNVPLPPGSLRIYRPSPSVALKAPTTFSLYSLSRLNSLAKDFGLTTKRVALRLAAHLRF
jgi:hypothetical protein